jgi:hypothetical protein
MSVATGTVGVPLERSYTNALPALVAPVLSSGAPTTTRLPEIAIEWPKVEVGHGPGSFSVATGTVGVALARSYTYALPASNAFVSSR